VSEILYSPIKALNFMSSIKSRLSNLFRLVEIDKHGDEYQQAVARLVLMSLTILIILFSYHNIQTSIYAAMAGYSLLTIGLLTHTRIKSSPSHKRQLFGIVLDVCATSHAMYLTNDVGAVFIGVYLWLVIGYGLRYGRTMLIVTYIASLIGFISASVLSNHWQLNLVAFKGRNH
jgi:two-component system, sensor histidine kinase RpfC